MKTYTLEETKATKEHREQRWMFAGNVDGAFSGVRYAKVALIPQRTLNTVGGRRAR